MQGAHFSLPDVPEIDSTCIRAEDQRTRTTGDCRCLELTVPQQQLHDRDMWLAQRAERLVRGHRENDEVVHHDGDPYGGEAWAKLVSAVAGMEERSRGGETKVPGR